MNFDYLVDASGEGCPMPLLRAKQQLNKMQEGECLKLISTDKGSLRDIPAFISLTHHELISGEETELESGRYVYYIVKR